MIAGSSALTAARQLAVALFTQGAVLASAWAQAPNASNQTVVAARRLERGTVLREGDIAFVPAPPPASAERAAVAPGWITRRVIQQGEVLRAPAVVPAPDVRAASPVAVVTTNGAVQVRVTGVAMSSGIVGDTILVALATGARVRARIEEPGRVAALASGRASR